MTERVVLLRGINVGGINIKMVDLRAALESAGYEKVRTVLATGNVLLDTAQSPAALKTSIEKTLSAAFGYQAWVIVLDRSTLHSIVADYPFDPERDGWHPYVIFGNEPDHLAELRTAADSLDTSVERLALGNSVLYWEVVKGNTLDSVVGKLSSKAKYKPTTTTRNLRTLIKLLA